MEHTGLYPLLAWRFLSSFCWSHQLKRQQELLSAKYALFCFSSLKVMHLSSLHGNNPVFLGLLAEVLWILHKTHARIDEMNRNIVVTFSISADVFTLAAIDQILQIEYLTIFGLQDIIIEVNSQFTECWVTFSQF